LSNWFETSKTVLLSLLILLSFFLTSILWSNQPQFQFIEQVEYVESKPVQTRQLEELVTPESIVFHYGEDRHTRIYANSGYGQFRNIQEDMEKWYFNNLTYYPLTEEKWTALTRDYKGLEIQFRAAVPLSVINQIFLINGEVNEQLKAIERLWLYYQEDENVVYALFMSKQDKLIYRARTVVSPKELLETYLPLGNPMPEQIMKVVKTTTDVDVSYLRSPFWNIYYLPKNPWKMQKYLYNYLPITEDQLMDAYFLDRNLVRRIVERDKTVIFTDGSRSIQLQPNTQYITYTDPAFQQGRKELTSEEKVRESISFVNKHLGWTDDYHFEKIEENESGTDVITFRQFIGPYPLISQGAQKLDTIRIVAEQGQVVSVNRSLIDLDKYIDNREWTVMSGPELFDHLRNNRIVDTERVQNAYLAYAVQVHQGYVELTPAWVVETLDQRSHVITMPSLRKGGEWSGLEQSKNDSNLGVSLP